MHMVDIIFTAQQPSWAYASWSWGFLNQIQLDTSQSVGLLWTIDRPIADIYT
jgi:hypothetical protein